MKNIFRVMFACMALGIVISSGGAVGLFAMEPYPSASMQIKSLTLNVMPGVVPTISERVSVENPGRDSRFLASTSSNTSATLDYNLPKPQVPTPMALDLAQTFEEELYWDHEKFGPQKGVASLYGRIFRHHSTTSGELYDGKIATAAHKKLPFGTQVKVTNMDPGPDYGKSVVVRINDRGPFVRGRIIDLSRSAAKKIGLTIGKGISKVKLELLKPRARVASNNRWIPTSNVVCSANGELTATRNINKEKVNYEKSDD